MKKERSILLTEEKIESKEGKKSARDILFLDKKQTSEPSFEVEYETKDYEEEFVFSDENEMSTIEENLDSEDLGLPENSYEEEFDEEKEFSGKAVIKQSSLPKKNMKVRIRLICAVYVVMLVGLGSWAVYNAVDIATLSETVTKAETDYALRLDKLLSNMNKLDQLTDSDSLTDIEGLSDAKIVNIAPRPFENPTQYTQESNWFDRLCNFFSRLFGMGK